MRYKHLLILLAAITFSLLLTSCIPGSDAPGSDSPPPAGTTSVPVDGGLEIVSGGEARVGVVRPENSGKEVERAVMDLLGAITELTGIRPKIKTDWLPSGETRDADTYEILVGKTEYDESNQALLGVENRYVIKFSGKKLIIAGDTEYATQKAVFVFLGLLPEFTDNLGRIVVPFDINLSGKCSVNPFDDLPEYPGGVITDYQSGHNASTICVSKTTVADFSAYVDLVKDEGFSVYAERTVGKNKFVTLEDGWSIINAIYVDYDKSARVIVDNVIETALPGLPSENVYESICTPLLTMLGLEYDYGGRLSNDQNGMCFVSRLSDGSFIIVDGGFKEAGCADRLYALLKKQAPDPDNIVIAAWFLTHAHSDHIGAFSPFTELYSKKVKVERFIIDLPSDEQMKITENLTKKVECLENMKSYAGSQIVLARPGQVFYIRNMTIEMLYTIELFAPRDLSYFNTSSLIFRMTDTGGQSTMILGDCSLDANDIISLMYGDYLKSDIVQAAHHGSEGGSPRLYMLIDPTYVLWPRGSRTFADSLAHNRNSYFKNAKYSGRIWCAGSTVTIHEFGGDPGAFTVYADIDRYCQ